MSYSSSFQLPSQLHFHFIACLTLVMKCQWQYTGLFFAAVAQIINKNVLLKSLKCSRLIINDPVEFYWVGQGLWKKRDNFLSFLSVRLPSSWMVMQRSVCSNCMTDLAQTVHSCVALCETRWADGQTKSHCCPPNFSCMLHIELTQHCSPRGTYCTVVTQPK